MKISVAFSERMPAFASSAPDLCAFMMIKSAEESKTWCCHTHALGQVTLMSSHCLHTLAKDEAK